MYERGIIKQEEDNLAKLALTADIGTENDLKPIAALLMLKINQLTTYTMRDYDLKSNAYRSITPVTKCVDIVIDELLEYIRENEDKYKSVNCDTISEQYRLMREIFIKNYGYLYKYILDSCINKRDDCWFDI